ncbi:MAG: hypothetical protein WBG08_11710 [Litorimonas sp.]
MTAVLFGVCLGLALGWSAYAFRRQTLAVAAAAGSVLSLVLMFAVLPLFHRTSLSYDVPHWELFWTLYAGLVPGFLDQALPWFVLSALLAYAAAAVRHKGFVTAPVPEETRARKRQRLQAEMRYSDPFLD